MLIRFKRADGTEDVVEAVRYKSALPNVEGGDTNSHPTISVVGGPTFVLDRPGDAVFIENGENRTIASFRHGDRTNGQGRKREKERERGHLDDKDRSTTPQLVTTATPLEQVE